MANRRRRTHCRGHAAHAELGLGKLLASLRPQFLTSPVGTALPPPCPERWCKRVSCVGGCLGQVGLALGHRSQALLSGTRGPPVTVCIVGRSQDSLPISLCTPLQALGSGGLSGGLAGTEMTDKDSFPLVLNSQVQNCRVCVGGGRDAGLPLSQGGAEKGGRATRCPFIGFSSGMVA